VFDTRASGAWTFQAEASTVLQTTEVASLVGELGAVYAPRSAPPAYTQRGKIHLRPM
jgi:hypothetical protein